MMIFSVNMPHNGYDEEDCSTELEVVRIITEEGKAICAKDFFIGGDFNIELKREDGSDDFEGFDSIDWYGLCGPECRGASEDVVTRKVTIRPETNSNDFVFFGIN